MAANGVGSIKGLEAYFEKRVLSLAKAAGRSYIVWQVRSSCKGPAADLCIRILTAPCMHTAQHVSACNATTAIWSAFIDLLLQSARYHEPP